MQEVKPAQQYGAPAAAPAAAKEKYIQHTPTWVLVIRTLTIIFSIIILGLVGWMLHRVVLESHAYTVAVVSRQPACSDGAIRPRDDHL